MNNSSVVESMLESVGRIFQAAHTSVLAMQDGERMQVKQLTQNVSVAVGMEPKQVLPFVNHYVHNTNLVYVTRGKNGGIIRGKRPEKVSSKQLESGGV